MLQVDHSTVFNHLPYEDFIPYLQEAYTHDYTVPERSFRSFVNGVSDTPSTLLQMPAWEDGQYLGIKNVTLSPHNSQFDKPTLQGVYLLFEAKNGTSLAVFDASAITARRTAAKSAVASSFLSRQDSEVLLMVGTGTLSTELIQAHSTVRPIKEVIIWEHTQGKGQKVIERLPGMDQQFSITDRLSEAVPKADIISVATMAVVPIINGQWLEPGQHVDGVGAYRTDMREMNDEVLERSTLFVDHNDAFEETGDLLIPLEEGIIEESDARATLFELCRKEKSISRDNEEITFFKSTGHALEDLSAAVFVYEQLKSD
jgi:ornithine cyclodeaminase